MTKRKKILIAIIGILVFLIVSLFPFSTNIDDADKQAAVSRALDALLEDERVLTNKGYIQLYDCNLVEDDGKLYFVNGLGIADSVFIKNGLKPIPKDRKLNVDDGDVIIHFDFEDIEGKRTDNIQFSYVFGSLGAQGYEIRIYRSLLFRYFVYVHKWVS